MQIGSNASFAALQRALASGGSARDTIVQQLIALRDDKAIPLLCYVLANTTPSGTLAEAHLQITEALGDAEAPCRFDARPQSRAAPRHVVGACADRCPA